MTDETQDRSLRAFFRECIVPSARALRERGISFFALEPDRTATSYWNVRPRDEAYVFTLDEDLAGGLHVMWRDYPELQGLANDLATMTRTLAERREGSADVSSFIYAMF